jgi:ribosomal protein S18 acetylase RimI-like enzyme
LLDAALETVVGRDGVLLVVPSTSLPGRALAESRGATLSHSEHFLVLGDLPSEVAEDDAVTLRVAGPSDWPEVRRVFQAACRWEPPERQADRPGDTTYVISRGTTVVGTVRLSVTGETAGVYGFAVDPAYQGQGIGRDVLARVCRQARRDGFVRVTLEVETENEHALRLYTSTGFVREAGEDYWRLTTS